MGNWNDEPSPQGLKYGFWLAVTAFIVVMYVACANTDAKPLQEFLRLLNVALSVGVVTAYLPESVRRSLKPRLDSADLLLIGITIGWLGQAFVSGWVLLWRLAGQPAWMINSDVTNVAVAIQIVGCALHLVAPGAVGGVVPRKNMVLIGAITALSTAIALVIATETPHVRAYLQRLEPLIESPRNKYDSRVDEPPVGVRAFRVAD